MRATTEPPPDDLPRFWGERKFRSACFFLFFLLVVVIKLAMHAYNTYDRYNAYIICTLFSFTLCRR